MLEEKDLRAEDHMAMTVAERAHATRVNSKRNVALQCDQLKTAKARG